MQQQLSGVSIAQGTTPAKPDRIARFNVTSMESNSFIKLFLEIREAFEKSRTDSSALRLTGKGIELSMTCVNFKRTSILVLLLFAWNTLFGAVGGLLICIHADLQVHSEVVLNPEEHCETDHISGEGSTVAFNAQKDCVDVELDAVQILSVKPEYSDADSLSDSPQLVDAWNFNSPRRLRGLAPALRAQAPPELTSVSVHVVQLIQLRI